jgi:Icc-related predicted phosphoesterase
VRECIEKYQPELCLCGHIHESRAKDRIGRTPVINPGNLGSGGYVILRPALEGGKPGVLAELKVLGEKGAPV